MVTPDLGWPHPVIFGLGNLNVLSRLRPDAHILRTRHPLVYRNSCCLHSGHGILGERVLAKSNPRVNTVNLVGPALEVAFWSLAGGHIYGDDGSPWRLVGWETQRRGHW